MPALQVKECPAAVYERLRECAARENRSISQQALTIIEGYLGMRESVVNPFSPKSDSQDSCHVAHESAGCYIDRRKKVFEAISNLRPIPVSKKTPDSAEILHQMRKEDAR